MHAAHRRRSRSGEAGRGRRWLPAASSGEHAPAAAAEEGSSRARPEAEALRIDSDAGYLHE